MQGHWWRRRAGRRGIVAAAAIVVAGGAVACQPVPTVLDLTVNTSADGNDAAPGDGVCEVTTGSGECTLRAAISESNATEGHDAIAIAPGVHPVLSVAGNTEDANATGDLDVTGDVTVTGAGATVDAAGLDRVFDVRAGHLTLVDLEVTGGHPPRYEQPNTTGNGAGIRALGDLTLERVHVVGNVAEQSTEGSAIFAAAASVKLTDTEVADNTFLSTGGTASILLRDGGQLNASRTTVADPTGIAIKTYGSNVVLIDSSVFAKQAVALYQATGIVTRSTLVGPPNGPQSRLVWQSGGSLHVGGSILTLPGAQEGDLMCNSGVSPITSLGWNVASDDSCALAGPGDLEVSQILLHPLSDNGGHTRTFLPAESSRALDRIPVGTANFCDGNRDQRGEARPVGTGCDAGSVEGVGGPISTLSLTVDSAADGVDVLPGDGNCTTSLGTCTLRAAIMETNAYNQVSSALADTVVIAPGIDPTIAIAGADEDGGATGDLDITAALVLEGGGATVDGAGLDRVFDVFDFKLIVRDLTVVGGAVTGDGGGIRATGDLEAERVIVRGNSASAGGGGISGEVRAITVTDSDIDGNAAGEAGGGIAGTLVRVYRSLIRNNSAGSWGGGIGLDSIGSTYVEDSTITANSADLGGSAVYMSEVLAVGTTLVRSTVAYNIGSPSLAVRQEVCTRICYPWAAVTAQGSILVGLPGEPVCDDPVVAPEHNLAPDGSCGATVGGADLLGPLADNGGPTLTFAPGTGSAAIDAIPAGTAGLCDAGLADQRSTARPFGPACDIGAVEQ